MFEWCGRRQPLIFLNDNEILCYRFSRFEVYSTIKNTTEVRGSLKQSPIFRAFEHIPLLRRLFRLEIRCGCSIGYEYYFFKNKKLYCLDLDTFLVKEIYYIPKGWSVPLNIIKGDSKYKVLWGEYGNNIDLNSVSIIGIDANNNVVKLFSFESGTIRHIHNIIKDEYGNGYYVLTGDHGKYVGIYYTDSRFSDMKPILIGKQKYRAVQGFSIPNGLIYASDAVNEENYIYQIKEKNNTWNIDVVCKINGSCIYGTDVKEGFVVSTTVESDESNGKKSVRNMMSRKRAKGILSDNVELIHVSKDLKASIIFRELKDKYPYKLFQYGTIRFAKNSYNRIAIYPVAIKKYDGHMGIRRVDNL